MPENPEANLHDLILANDWRQGSFALPSDLGLNSESDSETVFIAVTQTCDLANSDLEKEPEVEFVKAQKISKKKSQFENLANPRILHIVSDQTIYEITLKKRYFVSRERLTEIISQGLLEEKPLRTLQDFMARRYRRPAYADEFNNRWQRTEAAKQIRKKLNELHELLEMILVGNSIILEKNQWEQEQTDRNTYLLDFVGILALGKSTKDERQADKILQEVVDSFNTCIGIKATGEIKLIDSLSFLEFFNSVIWDTDSISNAAGTETIASQI